MDDDDSEWLAREPLMAHEWSGVVQLAEAGFEFVPVAVLNTSETIARRLVAIGLAERGTCAPAYAARGFDTGYRLTELGLKVKDRGPDPKR